MQVLYFAWVRERIGQDEDVVSPPGDVADVAGLIAWLAARGGGYAAALGEPGRLRVAVDGVFADPSTPIAGVREVSIFPPVTGG